MMNGVVVGRFGGHYDLFNYTEMLVALSTTPGVCVCVTSLFAMNPARGLRLLSLISPFNLVEGPESGKVEWVSQQTATACSLRLDTVWATQTVMFWRPDERLCPHLTRSLAILRFQLLERSRCPTTLNLMST